MAAIGLWSHLTNEAMLLAVGWLKRALAMIRIDFMCAANRARQSDFNGEVLDL